MRRNLLLLLTALLPMVASAYDAYIDGIFYNFSGNAATVTYMSNYNGHHSVYSGSVTIPASVTYNGKTYSVTSIGEYAFYNCSSLTSITIPNSVTTIGYSAFEDCSGLTSVTIPNSVTSIGGSAFTGCSGLTSINIPNSVTSIGEWAFSGCSGLTSITIPNSVTSIDWSAFRLCSSLTSIVIPENVTDIGYGAFECCSSLTSIKVVSGNSKYDSRNTCNAIIETSTNTLIAGCKNTTIPNSVTSIGKRAFEGCSGLKSIIIPNSVTSIGNEAFLGCSGLTSITIPNSVTSIGSNAFNNCTSLTSVTIPNSVTSIGSGAFSVCSGLVWIEVYKETPLSIDSNCFSNRTNAVLYVPYGSKSAYETADYWEEFKEIREMPNSNAISVGSSGFATFASPNALDFSGITDIKAYVASDFDSDTYTLTLTRVTESPGEEGLYIVGEAGTYIIPETTTDAVYPNLLKGVTYPTTISPTDGDYTNFILANGKHGVAFYSLSEAGELAAGKAYLQLPTASVSEVKAISIIFDDDDPTGIASPLGETGEGAAIYNLQGQRVREAKNGLYIINGKKVFIK